MNDMNSKNKSYDYKGGCTIDAFFKLYNINM